jgi:hypothetical protein
MVQQLAQIKDPYLRGAFRFLTSGGPPFPEVLLGNDLPMQDKVGFACRFLPDDQVRSTASAAAAVSHFAQALHGGDAMDTAIKSEAVCCIGGLATYA